METYPESVLSTAQADWPDMPAPIIQEFDTGHVQTRDVMAVGRTWAETLIPGSTDEDALQFVLAFLNWHYSRGLTFWKKHPRLGNPNRGNAGGAPVVSGAGQTGSSLVTSGWTGSNPVLKAGDVFRVAGIGWVYDVVEDASHASGSATLKINPPIWAGGEPADGAALTVQDVQFQVKIIQPPQMPTGGPSNWFRGTQVIYREVPVA